MSNIVSCSYCGTSITSTCSKNVSSKLSPLFDKNTEPGFSVQSSPVVIDGHSSTTSDTGTTDIQIPNGNEVRGTDYLLLSQSLHSITMEQSSQHEVIDLTGKDDNNSIVTRLFCTACALLYNDDSVCNDIAMKDEKTLVDPIEDVKVILRNKDVEGCWAKLTVPATDYLSVTPTPNSCIASDGDFPIDQSDDENQKDGFDQLTQSSQATSVTGQKETDSQTEDSLGLSSCPMCSPETYYAEYKKEIDKGMVLKSALLCKKCEEIACFALSIDDDRQIDSISHKERKQSRDESINSNNEFDECPSVKRRKIKSSDEESEEYDREGVQTMECSLSDCNDADQLTLPSKIGTSNHPNSSVESTLTLVDTIVVTHEDVDNAGLFLEFVSHSATPSVPVSPYNNASYQHNTNDNIDYDVVEKNNHELDKITDNEEETQFGGHATLDNSIDEAKNKKPSPQVVVSPPPMEMVSYLPPPSHGFLHQNRESTYCIDCNTFLFHKEQPMERCYECHFRYQSCISSRNNTKSIVVETKEEEKVPLVESTTREDDVNTCTEDMIQEETNNDVQEQKEGKLPSTNDGTGVSEQSTKETPSILKALVNKHTIALGMVLFLYNNYYMEYWKRNHNGHHHDNYINKNNRINIFVVMIMMVLYNVLGVILTGVYCLFVRAPPSTQTQSKYKIEYPTIQVLFFMTCLFVRCYYYD